jgi:hypothetical protein
MKNANEQIKGLSAWHVMASAFGRDWPSSATRTWFAPKTAPQRLFMLVRRPPASGLMTLRAVREGEGAPIVDFEWAYVSPLAARLLDRDASALVGHRLLCVLSDEHQCAVLLDHYRAVIEHGAGEPLQHRHAVDGSARVLRHDAVRLGNGVVVTLSDVSPRSEHEAPQIQWLRLDGAFGRGSGLVQQGNSL